MNILFRILDSDILNNNMAEIKDETVIFKCVKEGVKLRIRIITKGYNNDANCQFPRDIRKDGSLYQAPVNAVTFAKGPAGKFFYRVNKKYVKEIIDKDIKYKIDKIYTDEDPECVICLINKKDIVLVPCGHFNLCSECVKKIKESCPYCRGHIDAFATLDQIQF